MIQTVNGEIHWFMYSSIGSFSSDYVLIQDENGIDTLCVTTNLYDIHVHHTDSLELIFSGKPENMDDNILIPDEFQGFKIIVNDSKEYKTEQFIHGRFNIENKSN